MFVSVKNTQRKSVSTRICFQTTSSFSVTSIVVRETARLSVISKHQHASELCSVMIAAAGDHNLSPQPFLNRKGTVMRTADKSTSVQRTDKS